MSYFKRITIGMAVTVGLFVLIGLFLPNEYTAQAERVIPNSMTQVHETINNLETWKVWGPWMDDDPNMKITADVTSGVGATQHWESESGSGRLVFRVVDPDKGVKYDVFFDDFPKSEAEFSYDSMADNKTKVTWTMKGTVNIPIMGGYLAYMFKKMISNDFSEGLQNIESFLEKRDQ